MDTPTLSGRREDTASAGFALGSEIDTFHDAADCGISEAAMLESVSVRQWRERLGLTQIEASLLIGWSFSRFCIYDRGEADPPLRMRRAMHSVEIERQNKVAA